MPLGRIAARLLSTAVVRRHARRSLDLRSSLDINGNDWTTLVALVDVVPFLSYLLSHLLCIEAALLVLQDLCGWLRLHQGVISLPRCPQIVVWETDGTSL